MLAVTLALIAALSWGAADFLGGLAARGRALLAVMLVSQAAGLVVLLAVALPAAGSPPAAADLVPAVVGGVCGVLALSLLYLALAIGTMSVVAPIVALSATIPVVVSLVTGEQLTGAIAVGIVLALGGAASSAAASPAADADHSDQRRRSLWLAVGAAVGFGAALVMLDAAADSGPLWTVIVARSSAVLAVLAAFAARPVALELRAPGVGSVVLVGILDAASLTLFTLASNEGMLSVVSVLASLYPVVTVLLARAVLGERMRPVQVAGVAVAFAGIALIASGS